MDTVFPAAALVGLLGGLAYRKLSSSSGDDSCPEFPGCVEGDFVCYPDQCAECPAGYRFTGVVSSEHCPNVGEHKGCICDATPRIVATTAPALESRVEPRDDAMERTGAFERGPGDPWLTPVDVAAGATSSSFDLTPVELAPPRASRPASIADGLAVGIDRLAIAATPGPTQLRGSFRRADAAVDPRGLATIARATTMLQTGGASAAPRRRDPNPGDGSSPRDSDGRRRAALVRVGLTAYAWIAWYLRMERPSDHAPADGVEVIPWAQPEAAGLTVLGRF